jgi:hypothetical protein
VNPLRYSTLCDNSLVTVKNGLAYKVATFVTTLK